MGLALLTVAFHKIDAREPIEGRSRNRGHPPALISRTAVRLCRQGKVDSRRNEILAQVTRMFACTVLMDEIVDRAHRPCSRRDRCAAARFRLGRRDLKSGASSPAAPNCLDLSSATA